MAKGEPDVKRLIEQGNGHNVVITTNNAINQTLSYALENLKYKVLIGQISTKKETVQH